MENPGQDNQIYLSEGLALRQSLMFIAAKTSHEKVSVQDLRELLQCDPATFDSIVEELHELNVLSRIGRRAQTFEISPECALGVS